MRIAIGADHAGFALKEDLKDYLREQGHQVHDLGTESEQPTDYPPTAPPWPGRSGTAGRSGGSFWEVPGRGEQITANKVRGIRAALCHDLYTARMSRSHNDTNVLSMGARIVAPELARLILETWLQSDFEGGRHQRRVEQITEIEREETSS